VLKYFCLFDRGKSIRQSRRYAIDLFQNFCSCGTNGFTSLLMSLFETGYGGFRLR
jgi:hypothetical protein